MSSTFRLNPWCPNLVVILVLVGCVLPLEVFAELMLGVLPDFETTLSRGTGNAFELMHESTLKTAR